MSPTSLFDRRKAEKEDQNKSEEEALKMAEEAKKEREMIEKARKAAEEARSFASGSHVNPNYQKQLEEQREKAERELKELEERYNRNRDIEKVLSITGGKNFDMAKFDKVFAALNNPNAAGNSAERVNSGGPVGFALYQANSRDMKARFDQRQGMRDLRSVLQGAGASPDAIASAIAQVYGGRGTGGTMAEEDAQSFEASKENARIAGGMMESARDRGTQAALSQMGTEAAVRGQNMDFVKRALDRDVEAGLGLAGLRQENRRQGLQEAAVMGDLAQADRRHYMDLANMYRRDYESDRDYRERQEQAAVQRALSERGLDLQQQEIANRRDSAMGELDYNKAYALLGLRSQQVESLGNTLAELNGQIDMAVRAGDDELAEQLDAQRQVVASKYRAAERELLAAFDRFAGGDKVETRTPEDKGVRDRPAGRVPASSDLKRSYGGMDFEAYLQGIPHAGMR